MLTWQLMCVSVFSRWRRAVWNGHIGGADQVLRYCEERLRSMHRFSPSSVSWRQKFFSVSLTLSLSLSVFIWMFWPRTNLWCFFFFFCLPQGLYLICVWQSVPSCSGCMFRTNPETYLTPTMPHPSDNERNDHKWRSEFKTVPERPLSRAFVSTHFPDTSLRILPWSARDVIWFVSRALKNELFTWSVIQRM